LRRPRRGTRRSFTILWVAVALLVGMLGLGYRTHHADSHAHGSAGTPSEQVGPRSNSGSHPSEPTGVRNG
jgi:hypothetical protein